MKIEELDEFNEMNYNNTINKEIFIHKPTKSLSSLNNNIFKNILTETSDTDSENTEAETPKEKINIKFNFKKIKKVKFSQIEIIRVESYKKYNKNNENKNKFKQKKNEKCLIF
jgi:hypothetical protein